MKRWTVLSVLMNAVLALGLFIDTAAMAAADLTVEVSRIGAGPVFTGTTIKLLVEVSNSGDIDANNVSVVTKLPALWSFVQAGQSGCTTSTVPIRAASR